MSYNNNNNKIRVSIIYKDQLILKDKLINLVQKFVNLVMAP